MSIDKPSKMEEALKPLGDIKVDGQSLFSDTNMADIAVFMATSKPVSQEDMDEVQNYLDNTRK